MYDLKILLCDDSLLVRKKMINALQERGFTQLFEASDGEEAISVCRAERPNLVLLDIVMPKKDGLEALVEIKELDPKIQVVMVSSVGTQGKLMQAIKLGAFSFLQKPVTIDAVIDVISKLGSERGDS
ncbi:MAG: response regulator [Candidatus Cohnella colombiensis]|uniref:Response regulator n=1 Tax=Candidatus Cohnella colombiensis TaxID=3121368 RepID=A0AA95EZI2_9BACL|nr:MAG: response regulator [Cohnella sp.]